MNLKGCNLELAHRNSQASIPFYVSSLGYGFLWHNAAVGEVHFGTNTTEWLARTTKQLDYWVTAGDTPAEIEEHFADAIGKVPMMPEYGLGFIGTLPMAGSERGARVQKTRHSAGCLCHRLLSLAKMR